MLAFKPFTTTSSKSKLGPQFMIMLRSILQVKKSANNAAWPVQHLNMEKLFVFMNELRCAKA
jgi:hypothetical protein